MKPAAPVSRIVPSWARLIGSQNSSRSMAGRQHAPDPGPSARPTRTPAARAWPPGRLARAPDRRGVAPPAPARPAGAGDPEAPAPARTRWGGLAGGQRIVDHAPRSPKLVSSARMSGTRLLRRSGTFSLKVSPSTPTRARRTGTSRAISSLTSFCATKRAHAVVDPPAGQDHLGVVAQALGLGGQVVGIDADAVAADQARRERQEVPLRRRRRAARRGCGCPAGRRSAPARSSARC